MEKELISVIVPIYNVENYLKKCIDSIINQSYTNLEIILVDDGSTDSCGLICDEYSKKDKRIKVIHKQNGGVSHARNIGIDHANGQYISFVDSDDYIEKDMIMHLKNNIKNKDLSVCGYQKVYLDEVIEKDDVKENAILTKQEFKKNLFYNGEYKYHYQGITPNKLFRSQIIENNKIRFNEKIAYNEDRLFLYEYINKCEKNIFISKYIGYNYFQRPGSAILQKNYIEDRYTEFVSFDIMSEMSRKNKEYNIDDIIRVEYVSHSQDMYIFHYSSRNSEIKKYKKMAEKYIMQILLSINVRFKVKWQIIKKHIKIKLLYK